MQTGQLISLALYFVAMLGIGLYAWRTSTDDVSGYMLGGRKLSPAVASLSAGASDMSGWMLLGLPGAMYVSGLSASWIAIGLFIGALVNWIVVAPRLRVHTQIADDAITIPDYFEKRFEDRSRMLRVMSSIVIVIFFTLYTSSGVVAGGKLFESAFGADYALGLWITAGVVVVYTLFGGFLAVSLTDFVQGCIMFVALVLVPVVALTDIGGAGGLQTTLNGIDPGLLNLFGGMTAIGIISAMAWGLGYFGQPHIIVRFMAIRSVADVPRARNIGMTWMGVTLIGALSTGLIGLAYATQTGLPVDDPETIFIILSQILFHPLIAGFLLAAILAAIMSTISSQLLVSSSSLTEDFYAIFLRKEAGQKELVTIGRLSVVAVSLVAIALAYNPNSNVLGLVSNAWAGFGAAFGPIVLLSLTWNRMTRNGALAGMIAGAATVLFWIYVPVLADGATLSSVIYEIVPGFLVCGAIAVSVSLLGREPADTIAQTFEQARVARTS
ncbi:sodium/proline symporter PutP [Parasphingopyxis algicola]|uniref:sodium/proline symporter PutP n=1 Tax=Parasphingopyxis algicola TaxID=2026624 RepID=UPI0015A185AF|nr:sodium/proline symporter PutP [Parasphingopyxis algicola]QLC24182.1 sodium/proline symporter PutP [Parasphingopyxis algicola]